MAAHIVTVALPEATPEAVMLSQGAIFQSIVRGAEDSPWIIARGVRIELPITPLLLPGASVRLEVVSTKPSLQLRILPLENDHTARAVPGGGMASSVTGLTARTLPAMGHILRQLDVSLLAPGDALTLAPEHMPLTATAMRQLLAIFLAKESLGATLTELHGLLREAIVAGISLAPDLASLFEALLTREIAEPSQAALLLTTVRQSQATEARIAEVVRRPDVLEQFIAQARQSLRSQLTLLSGQEAVLAYMRGKGQLRRFETLVKTTLERLDAAELQNLHGLRRPYIFLEAPLGPDMDIPQCRIHVFPEKDAQGGKRNNYASRGSVVFDLETRHLGSLWIRLTVSTEQCHCTIKTTHPAAHARFEASATELSDALAAAGYPKPMIRIERWDGNRLRETIRLMGQFASINYDG